LTTATGLLANDHQLKKKKGLTRSQELRCVQVVEDETGTGHCRKEITVDGKSRAEVVDLAGSELHLYYVKKAGASLTKKELSFIARELSNSRLQYTGKRIISCKISAFLKHKQHEPLNIPGVHVKG
jgi:hypothetical protein